MTNIIWFSHQKLKLKRKLLKSETKNKKYNSFFLSPPATPINFIENLTQNLFESRVKYKEQANTDKFKKMGSSKIRKIRTDRITKENKRNRETA